MGLFSKKEYVCEKCGKTYVRRINFTGNLCDDCWNHEENEKRMLEKTVKGYVEYNSAVFFKSYTSEEMRAVMEHRENILDKLCNNKGISRAELVAVSDNYKKLSDDEAERVLYRVASSAVSVTTGAAYGGSFFIPTRYEGMVVDAADVFAVGYTTDYRIQAGLDEVILCAVFTNDPYVPVFPMIYVGKTGFFELSKSKKGREGVNAIFESMCPNLTYPVDDLKVLKKTLKQEGSVRGKLELKFVLEQISNATSSCGIFDTKKMHSELLPGSIELMDRMGYIPNAEIDKILKMDKIFNRSYWNKQMDRVFK